MMENIDKLLDKYFEGETSLQEEKELRQYFQNGNVEERHLMYAPMFDFFLEERKEAVIEKKRKIPLYVWVSIAASILLVVCVKSFYQPLENETSKSLVYVDGKKITDMQRINSEALISIQNISEIDEDIINSQIDILDAFTE